MSGENGQRVNGGGESRGKGEGHTVGRLESGKRGIVQSFVDAGRGVVEAVRMQRNMRVHVAAVLLAVSLGVWLGLSAVEWGVIFLCVVLVPALESMNTAVEAVVDLVSPEWHELARRAKDCAAGAVLLGSLGAVGVAGAIFVPKLWAVAQQLWMGCGN